MTRNVKFFLSASLLALSVLWPGCGYAESSETLIEVRRHMLDPEINTLTFRSMDQIFDTLPVKRGGRVWTLEADAKDLDFSYSFEGEDIPAAAFAERTFTNALLIAKHGKIVHERYLNKTDETTRFLSMSMAKSITSILVGMAIEDGYISSVDDPLETYVPELKGSGYEGVTIRQALLMRSGVDWNERYDFGKDSPMQKLHNAAVVENRIRFVTPAFGAARIHPPGNAFNYSTVETAVLGLVLEKAVGKPLPDYMSARWWRRAGMQSDGFWIADGPPGVGRAINGMGFNATLRDYARIGLMMLSGGKANGKRLLSSAWVEESTVPKGTEPTEQGSTRGYQYQWWTFTDSDAYTALGLQGQFIYVDPRADIVVVKVSYFPPGERRADAETEAFLRAVSTWNPR